MLTFAVPSLNKREHSSAGSEHLPYKQRVRGSNPFAPTKIQEDVARHLLCFCAYAYSPHFSLHTFAQSEIPAQS